MTDLTLTVERTIQAPPETVFNAWLDPEMMRRFLMPRETMSVPSASNDPREGGRFDILMRSDDREFPHWGIYREIRPHDRLVFTWQSPFSVEDSTVTLTFAPVDSGTHVTLTQVRFHDAEARDSHANGWTGILESLAKKLAA